MAKSWYRKVLISCIASCVWGVPFVYAAEEPRVNGESVVDTTSDSEGIPGVSQEAFEEATQLVKGEQAQKQSQLEEYNRQLEESRISLKQQAQLQKEVEISQARYEAILEREEAFLLKSEQQQKRYEEILGTWETQQLQFQRYLDKLSQKGSEAN